MSARLLPDEATLRAIIRPGLEEAARAGALAARETIARHFEAQAEQALAGKKLVGRFARAEELRAMAAEIREVEV